MMTSRTFSLHEGQLEGEPHIGSAACRQPIGLFVDRTTQQWVVRDPAGELWLLGARGVWNDRRPFEMAEETELQIVPGHYRYMLDLPF
jgi:hypothetical protein